MTRLRGSIQPGWYQSGSSSLTDEIGTSGCEASPERYGYGLNRRTGAGVSARSVKPLDKVVEATITLKGQPERCGFVRSYQKRTPARGKEARMTLNTFIPPRPEGTGLPERSLCEWVYRS